MTEPTMTELLVTSARARADQLEGDAHAAIRTIASPTVGRLILEALTSASKIRQMASDIEALQAALDARTPDA